MAICETCGKDFKPHYTKQVARYCSRACYAQARSLPKRACALCGNIFQPPHEINLYCTKACSNRARAVPPEVRFWNHVDKSGECWLWTAALDNNGQYGWFAFSPTKLVPAHRYAYQLANGPIPDGLLVLHRCDNPRCVRHDHLFPGTHQDNMDDMVQKGRHRNRRSVPPEPGRAP